MIVKSLQDQEEEEHPPEFTLEREDAKAEKAERCEEDGTESPNPEHPMPVKNNYHPVANLKVIL
jgi:hypothetical protein